MTITKHARIRLKERFKVTHGADIKEICRRLEKDFIRKEFEGGDEYRTIIWGDEYLQGVITENTLVTVINRGWRPIHFVAKWNPDLQEGKNRRRRNTWTKKQICSRNLSK